MTPRAAVISAIVLACVHFGLAIWFSSVTPYRTAGVILMNRHAPAPDIGAPDEDQHVNYIAHLVGGKGFPVFDPSPAKLAQGVEFHQPPAFYLLAAGWSELTGATDLATIDSGHKLRALNGIVGAVGVFAAFLLGFWGYKRPEVGVVAAAFAALLPMNVALSGAISNDSLLIALSGLILALCAKCVHEGWSFKRCVAIGVLVGLALMTKTTALSLLPAILLALILSQPRPKVKEYALLAVPALLVVAPWWARNESLYGDPLALKAFSQAFVNTAQAKTFIEGFGMVGYLFTWVIWWTARSFLGAFGYMDIWLNETGAPMGSAPNTLYRLFFALTFVVVLGWAASWKTESDPATRAVRFMNIAFTVIVALLFLRFNLQYFQAQGRYLLPALGPISCAYAVGSLRLAKDRWIPVLACFILLLGGITVYAGTRLPEEFQKRTV